MTIDKDKNIVRDKGKAIDKHKGPEKGNNNKHYTYTRYVTCQDQEIWNSGLFDRSVHRSIHCNSDYQNNKTGFKDLKSPEALIVGRMTLHNNQNIQQQHH